jgi:hypothetical protein
MNPSEEIWALRLLILEDERLLQSLNERESSLQVLNEDHDFQSATTRENLLSEIAVVEERLRKNRQFLADLSV